MRSALISALILLSACATAPANGGPSVHLSGTSWTRVDDAAAAPHNPTIEFAADGRAGGFAGCNRWFGGVTQSGEELRFDGVGATRMACMDGNRMQTEQSFLAVLAATRYGHYDQDALVLLDAQQRQLARFERKP